MQIDLLKMLEQLGDPYLRWVCRDSTSDRGLRLHQVHEDTADRMGWTTYQTPREAVVAYLKQKGIAP